MNEHICETLKSLELVLIAQGGNANPEVTSAVVLELITALLAEYRKDWP